MNYQTEIYIMKLKLLLKVMQLVIRQANPEVKLRKGLILKNLIKLTKEQYIKCLTS